MKKKIVLMFLAILILSVPIQQNYIETHAAVVSKAASATAKKIVKEVIQDAAVNQAANMALLEAMDIVNKYEAKPGFKVVCPTGAKTCDKPIQIKETITETDKSNIKKQAGTELDKLILGGKGASKWTKFLDWFAPIWLIGFAIGAITYAVDPDVKSLFDEAAYNTLVALGIIQPIKSVEIEPIKDVVPPVVKEKKYEDSDGTVQDEFGKIGDFPNGSHNFKGTTPNSSIEVKNLLTVAEFNVAPGEELTAFRFGDDAFTTQQWGFTNNTILVGGSEFGMGRLINPIVTINLNSKTIFNGVPSRSGNLYSIRTDTAPELESILTKQMRSIQHRTPYKLGDFYYTDMLFNTVSGDVIEVQTRSDENENRVATRFSALISTRNSSSASTYSVRIFQNITPNKRILVPTYSDFGQGEMSPTDLSSYKDDKGNIALIPPVAIPYQEESTGEEVKQVPNANGDGWTFQKPDGTIVPEEEVIPDPNWEPNITPSPDGVPQITPTPTPSNPNPEPIPLKPDPNAPPANQPPEEPPLEPFPDGAKCDAKLKFPIFSPLKETLQTSFPFSIPWDIERAALAIFGGISNEKPNFKIAIPFLGETHEVHITIPKFMDDWKPFMDSFLLITFDLLLMFGLYRFVKGAGS